jgi:phosphoserine phosphatase
MTAAPGWQLACFDLDGTLVRQTSISEFLGGKLGRRAELLALETAYSNGEIASGDVAVRTAESFCGRSLEWVAQALEDLPYIDGIAATLAALRDRGVESLISTVTWRFAAEVVRVRHGFVAACGTEMPCDESGLLGGRVARFFDEHDKRRFVEDYCAERGIPLARCIAVGDSRSDVPLFGAVGFSIALNATPQARAAATVAIDTDDLTDILALIPERPDAERQPPPS